MTRVSQALAALVLISIAASASSCGQMPTPSGTVAPGVWGGENLRLTVTQSNAVLEFTCGSATIGSAIPVDRGGTFDVQGAYLASGPGPVTQGQPTRPLRVTGTLKGDTLTAQVVFLDDQSTLGTFTVVLGRSAQLVVCR